MTCQTASHFTVSGIVTTRPFQLCWQAQQPLHLRVLYKISRKLLKVQNLAFKTTSVINYWMVINLQIG